MPDKEGTGAPTALGPGRAEEEEGDREVSKEPSPLLLSLLSRLINLEAEQSRLRLDAISQVAEIKFLVLDNAAAEKQLNDQQRELAACKILVRELESRTDAADLQTALDFCENRGVELQNEINRLNRAGITLGQPINQEPENIKVPSDFPEGIPDLVPALAAARTIMVRAVRLLEQLTPDSLSKIDIPNFIGKIRNVITLLNANLPRVPS